MAFLNTSKAKEVLKKSGFSENDISKMQKGEANEVKISEEQIRKIINGDDNILEGLNAAGELLKNSALTRVTGHKTTDFSQVQSTSAANFATYCYEQLPEITITDEQMLALEKLDVKIVDEINIRISKTLLE